MKIALFIAAAITLSIPAVSIAQPAPFLTEGYRSAEMQVVLATGFYAVNRTATLTLNNSEGNPPDSMTLTVQGRKLKAQIWDTRISRCGDRYYARLFVPNNNIATDLVLVDYSNIRCRIYARDKWHATVTTHEPDGTESTMELVGNP